MAFFNWDIRFRAFATCHNSNCSFSTCCTNAMEDHRGKCKKGAFKIAEDPLPYEMFCVCGYKNTDGKNGNNVFWKFYYCDFL